LKEAEDARAGGRRLEAAGFDEEYQQQLIKRRLEALAVARTMSTDEVGTSTIEALEPEELQHVN
jgi:hypothetical protein